MPPVTNAQLADRIDVLSGNVCTAVDNIKELNKGFNLFQLDYERRHAELTAKVMTQETEIKVQKDALASLTNIVTQQTKEIGDLKETVKTLQDSVNKIMGWVNKLFWALFIPFVLGIFSFVIGLLTHTIVITFPK